VSGARPLHGGIRRRLATSASRVFIQCDRSRSNIPASPVYCSQQLCAVTVSQPQDGVPVKATEPDVLSDVRPNPTVEVNTTVVVYAGRPLDPAAAASSGHACEVGEAAPSLSAAPRLHVHKQVIEPNARSAKESRICPEIGGKSHSNAIDLGQQDRGMRHCSNRPSRIISGVARRAPSRPSNSAMRSMKRKIRSTSSAVASRIATERLVTFLIPQTSSAPNAQPQPEAVSWTPELDSTTTEEGRAAPAEGSIEHYCLRAKT